MQRSKTAPMMSVDGGKDDAGDVRQDALQAELKRAASQRLGADLETVMKADDAEAFREGSDAMAAAIREAKEKFAARKREIGVEGYGSS